MGTLVLDTAWEKTTAKMLTHDGVLEAGAMLKAEFGAENELAAEVPAGKVWAVHAVIYVLETDA